MTLSKTLLQTVFLAMGFAFLAQGCVIEPHDGYYDHEHHRWYHEHQWHECMEHDEHCHHDRD
jgi:hypothetical protein